MNWMILTIILILFGIAYIVLNWLSKRYLNNTNNDDVTKNKVKVKEKKLFLKFILDDQIFQFVNGILVTLIGVIVAISFTNMDTKKNECSKTIDLLHVANQDIIQASEYMEAYYELLKTSDDDEYIQFLNDNTLPYPTIIYDVLKNDVVMISISTESYIALNSELRNLETFKNWLETTDNIDKKKLFVSEIKDAFYVLSKYIELEVDYLNGKISFMQLEDKHQAMYIEKMFPNGDIPDELLPYFN